MTEQRTENAEAPRCDPLQELAEVGRQYEQYLELARLGDLAAKAALPQSPVEFAPGLLSLVLWEQH